MAFLICWFLIANPGVSAPEFLGHWLYDPLLLADDKLELVRFNGTPRYWSHRDFAPTTFTGELKKARDLYKELRGLPSVRTQDLPEWETCSQALRFYQKRAEYIESQKILFGHSRQYAFDMALEQNKCRVYYWLDWCVATYSYNSFIERRRRLQKLLTQAEP